MSLLRLLSTGRSWVDYADDGPRYQVTHERLLPKFNSKKNPFRAPPKPAAARPESKLVPACGSSAGHNGCGASPAQRTPAAASAVAPGKSVGPSTSRNGVPWLTAAASKFKGRATAAVVRLKGLFARRPKPARPAVPAFAKPPVQGEFPLDHVRVVRNDLSDTDLEIVTAPGKAPGAPVVAQGKANLPVAPSAAPNPLRQAVRTMQTVAPLRFLARMMARW